jgi:UDP-N-acetylglucosamine--N-acetylmuramyl-(pentapeptide) pyrophosphoryl-undecaprenol N-acetylglucosamine transferase
MSAQSKVRKVMVMAGGTGGHVFPALAVAQELRRRGWQIDWLGTERGIEARIVPAADIPLHLLPITGVRGKGITALLRAPWKITAAVLRARRLFKSLQPDLVLGMGGYVAGPGGIAARTMNIPLLIHEQNARPGTTNKWLAKFATRVMTAFPGVLPGALCIGNPVRADIASLPEPAERKIGQRPPLRLLILGGSLGAQALNQIMPDAVADLLQQGLVQVRHQTGDKHLAATEVLYHAHNASAEVTAFIDNMAEALAWADLVVCRAGALTVAELSAAGIASILVPFPFAIDDHQTANANWLVSQGAAELYPQKILTAEILQERFMDFIAHPELLAKMAEAARKAAKLHAAQECADICEEVICGQR